MNIQPTLEVRWFFDELPFPKDAIFGNVQVQERIDWYALPCNEGCGIKVREGRLETKLRQKSEGPFERTDDAQVVRGELESWFKWSVPLPYDNMPTTGLLRDTGWISVHKRRWVRRFAVTSEGPLEMVGRVASGCSFELTELDVNGNKCWTVGYEAVGIESALANYLAEVVQLMHSEFRFGSGFETENSFGYPRWLNTRFA